MIRITIEGPTSKSTNDLTPDETSELNKALTRHLTRPLSERPVVQVREALERAPKVRTSHHRNKEEAARLQALVDERYVALTPVVAREPVGWPVQIKPLNWKTMDGNYEGQHVWTSGDPWIFWIVKNPDSPNYVWCENFNIDGFLPASPVRDVFANLDDAKNAAQIDFEKRVRAALTSPPPASAVREALEKIANAPAMFPWARDLARKTLASKGTADESTGP